MIDVWLHDKLTITRQRSLNFYVNLSYGRKANDVGELEITLPFGMVPPTLFTEDSVITVEEDGNLAFNTVWLVYRVIVNIDTITVRAKDAMHFLARRFVLFFENTAQAEKFQALDNMAKAVVRENLTNATDINRNLAGITTAADTGKAPAAELAFDGANVLNVLQEIANTSNQLGAYLTFDIVMTTAKTGVFTTWTGQRGIDRRTGSQARRFGPDYGNIRDAVLEIDYDNRASKITAWGAGEGSTQLTQTAQDPTPLYETRWGVIEDLIQLNNVDSTAQLLAAARSDLSRRTTKIRLSGEFQETQQTRYGRDIAYGDIIPVEAFGYTTACRVVAVQVSVSAPEIRRAIVLEEL